jgi:drug/metabolite transporter (DMT)-like permease
VIVAAKLYVQNVALEHVSPAFYAMMAGTLPVGVTVLSIVRGLEPFRVSTLAAAALVAVGGAMIEAGEMELSPFGFMLTLTALCLDVVRLVLIQILVQPLKLSGPGLMLLSSPLLCLTCAIGGGDHCTMRSCSVPVLIASSAT